MKQIKLKLKSEIVRQLSAKDLGRANGGFITSNFTSMATDCCETGGGGGEPPFSKWCPSEPYWNCTW